MFLSFYTLAVLCPRAKFYGDRPGNPCVGGVKRKRVP